MKEFWSCSSRTVTEYSHQSCIVIDEHNELRISQQWFENYKLIKILTSIQLQGQKSNMPCREYINTLEEGMRSFYRTHQESLLPIKFLAHGDQPSY